MEVAQRIQQVEVKLNSVLKDLGKDVGDFNALMDISEKDKLKYFFKLFVSSVGRKTKGNSPLLDNSSEKPGNFDICPDVIVENTRLA